MKVLKFILAGIAIIFVLTFAVSLFLSKSYYLERSTVIQAPAEIIFEQLGELKNWPAWSPWYEMDPDMLVVYGPETYGLGATNSWVGEKAGEGSITIVEFEPPVMVAFEMKFKGWEDSPSESSFTITPSGSGHSVKWTFSGDFKGNPIKRYFGLLFDTMVGTEYEKGLAKLKVVVEKEEK